MFLEDKKLICKECGKEFLFPGWEQKFFIEKGFVDPKVCKDCKKTRKIREV